MHDDDDYDDDNNDDNDYDDYVYDDHDNDDDYYLGEGIFVEKVSLIQGVFFHWGSS